jgi:hypothetical protein
VSQFLGEQIVQLGRGLRSDFGNDLNAGILPLEIADRLLPDLGRFGFPGDEAKLGRLRVRRRAESNSEDGKNHEKMFDQAH